MDLEKKNQRTVDVIIPVYRPDAAFGQLLKRLCSQTCPVRKILLINTDESLWKPELIQGIHQAQVRHIAKEAFDHGAARNLGASCSDADIIVFMTDDAMPKDRRLIENLVAGLDGEHAAMAYARQLAREDAGLAEQYTRAFNYPAVSCQKTLEDLPRLGIKTYFASNVCCAYDRAVFEQLGGFVTPAIFNEDMLYAAKAMKHGYTVVYRADAQVIHSHPYTLLQQFRRNFDLAVSQADHPEVFGGIASEGEGIRLVAQTAKFLLKAGKPWLLPGLIVTSACKYLGYRCGRNYKKLPHKLIVRFTMNPSYWNQKKEAKRS